MTKERCEDCYYKGINKCFMYNKNYEEVEKCTEYLIDPYYYRQKEKEEEEVIGVKPKK